MIKASFFLAATAAIGLPRPAAPQQVSGIPLIDSAAVARSAWGRASQALRAADTVKALREVERAASAWPMQPAYVWGAASLAAVARDTAALRRALSAYADLRLGRDLNADSSMAKFTKQPTFATLARRHDANRAPLERSRIQARLADTTFWPEGVDVDRRTGNLYIASIRHGTVAEVKPNGDTRELWKRHLPGVAAVMTVRVDPAGKSVWATSSGIPQLAGYRPQDSAMATIFKARISDGVIEKRIELPVAGNRYLGDLLVTERGDVFVTDSKNPVIFWVRPGADTAIAITSPLLRSPQGMALTPDGTTLYVADYSHGLMRVELASRDLSWVEPAPGIMTLGLDGMAWHKGGIVAVQNNAEPARLVRLTLSADGRRVSGLEVIDQNWKIADEPTSGTLLGDQFLYVANSQWNKHDDDGNRIPAMPLAAPIILAVPLTP